MQHMSFSTGETVPTFPVAPPHFIDGRQAKHYDYLYSVVASRLDMLSPSDMSLKASSRRIRTTNDILIDSTTSRTTRALVK